jgi:hypothetical protein
MERIHMVITEPLLPAHDAVEQRGIGAVGGVALIDTLVRVPVPSEALL